MSKASKKIASDSTSYLKAPHSWSLKHEEFDGHVATLNVGWSNCQIDPHQVVNTLVGYDNIEYIGFQEVSNQSKMEKIASILSAATETNYRSVCIKVGYARKCLIYDASKFNLRQTVRGMSYGGYELESILGSERHTAIVCHLPHKKNKFIASENLCKYVYEQAFPIIVGDFNCTPDEQASRLSMPKENFALTTNDRGTSPKSGRAIDNIVSPTRYTSSTVYARCHQFVDVNDKIDSTDHHMVISRLEFGEH